MACWVRLMRLLRSRCLACLALTILLLMTACSGIGVASGTGTAKGTGAAVGTGTATDSNGKTTTGTGAVVGSGSVSGTGTVAGAGEGTATPEPPSGVLFAVGVLPLIFAFAWQRRRGAANA
jgi:hypothetical protein